MHQNAKETTQRVFIKTRIARESNPENEGEEGSRELMSPKSVEPTDEQKIFEQRNAYIIIKVTLNEPLTLLPSPASLPNSADIARKAVKKIPTSYPNVLDAVQDFNNSIHTVVQEISIEYSRMFSGEDDLPVSISSQPNLKS